MTEIIVPTVPAKCKVCNSGSRFIIQKAIDNNATITMIATEFKVSESDIRKHIEGGHRGALLELGMADYVMRRKGIDVSLTLSNLIEKWSTGVSSRMPETIKDADAIRAMELYLKAQGELTNKHEITVKRTIEDALKDYLADDGGEEVIEVEAEEIV